MIQFYDAQCLIRYSRRQTLRWEGLRHKTTIIQKRLEKAQASLSVPVRDIDATAAEVPEGLGDLHAFLQRIPEDRLRTTFDAARQSGRMYRTQNRGG